ncbi:MAG: hypothetical protein R3E66_04350 [bacterium]
MRLDKIIALFVLLLVPTASMAQVVIENLDVDSTGAVSRPSVAKYREVQNVTCRDADVEMSNVHVKKGVYAGKNCGIVLRDCKIDGSVVAKDRPITLERCVVTGDEHVLWVDGKGDITVVDSEVNARRKPILLHAHSTGNVNLIRTSVKGGKPDVRGAGKIVDAQKTPNEVVIPKATKQRVRKGFTYQPEDLVCTGTKPQKYKKLHFDEGAVVIGGDCDIEIDGCIIDTKLVAVTAMKGNVTLRNCEIHGGAAAAQVAGAGKLRIIRSKLTSPNAALRTFSGSTGDIVVEKSKIDGAIVEEGQGKVVR